MSRPTAPSTKPPAANSGFRQPLNPSAELAAVIGPGPHTRTEATSRLWKYIKANGCQSQQNKREIVADTLLRPVLGSRCTMFEVPGHLNRHLT